MVSFTRPRRGCSRMEETRRVVTVDGEGAIELAEEPVPEPGAGEVLVDVEASLVTPGSGAAPVARRRQDPDPDREPRRRGYQAAGRVAGLGEGVDRFAVGDRVACMGSGYAYHADAVVVPANLTVALPSGVSYEAGAFNHLAATGLHAVRRGEVSVGEFVAVAGLGLVGQLTGQLAGVAGGRVAGVDLLGGRVERARAVGFDRAVRAEGGDDGSGSDVDAEDPVAAVRAFTGGRGIDCGVVAFGGEATPAFDQLVEMTRTAPDGHRYGRIVVVGGAHIEYDFPTALGNMDVRASSRPGPGYHDPEWERGAGYPTAYRGDAEWTTRRNLEESLRLMETGALEIEPLITHRLPLSEAAAGYDALIETPDEALGVAFRP